VADIAALGLSVDSDGVVSGAKALDNFAASADRAGKTAERTGGSTSKMGRDYSRAAKAAQEAAAAQKAAQAASAALGASNAQLGGHMAALASLSSNAARATSTTGDAATSAASGVGVLDARVESMNASLRATRPAAADAAASLGRVSAAANDNINSMRHNTGNIAAQFQDIGVTAAMGMNPMMIALQQGTQLSAVFAASGGNAFRTLGASIAQVLSPVAMLTIGLVGLLAAGMQMVDWAALAQSTMNGLADVLEEYSVAIAYAGAVTLLAFSPQILAAIWSGLVGIVGMLKSMAVALWALAAANPFTAIVLGIGVVLAAAYVFRDELSQILGFDIVEAARAGANWIVGGFVGTYNAITAIWSKLPAAIGDMAVRAANATIAAIEGMVNGAVSLINDLTSQLPLGLGDGMELGNASFGRLENAYAGAQAEVEGIANAALEAAQGVDYVGKGIAFVKGAASDAAGYLRDWASQVGEVADKEKKARKEREAKPKKTEAERQAEEWAKLTKDADNQMRALRQAGDRIGVYGEALTRLTYEQDLFNKAQDAGIDLTSEMTAELMRRAAAMAAQDTSNKNREFYRGTIQDTKEELALLVRQRGEVGLSGAALESYRYVTEKLLEAKRADIELTAAQIEVLHQQGDVIARTRAEVEGLAASWKRVTESSGQFVTEWLENQKTRVEDARETVGGFFKSWIDGARNGMGVIKSFGDAVMGTLNKIADRLLDKALDSFLTNLIPSNAGGGIMAALGFAKGGAFGPHGVTKFANGGAFTNSVVTQPTLFRFAKGSALGEMGEAGPEAIMPLTRGPGGKLGVSAHGGAQRVHVTVGVQEGPMFRPTVESISEDKAMQVTRAGLEGYDAQLPNRFQQIASDERMR